MGQATVDIAIIGCGHWGPNHIRTFSSFPEARVIAAADVSRPNLERVGKAYPSLALFEDYRRMLAETEAHAVVISTPTSTHHAIVRDALLADKHVLVEKPLCRTSEEGEELVALAAERGRLLMVGQVFLFNRGILKLKEYLQFGDLGRIYTLVSTRTNLGPIRKDVNAVYDLASHDIAIFDFLTGATPLEVSASGAAYLQPGVEDLAFITLRYPNDLLAHVHVSWLNPRKVREITVVGDKKMLVWDDLATVGPICIYDKGVVREPYYEDYGQFQLLAREGDIAIPRIQLEEPLKAQARYFLDGLRRGHITVSDGKSGLAVVRTLEAIQASLLQHGAPIPVSKAG
ncbi:MAG: Gfo/Idh/MocA family oxidoreductase [Chloracidobacterium sp.]|uniref:Gfo/Idh/MocA family oxidoreductase n=1 Tax=Chloracidobacterium validum TaxID=2821543 RepID=A0ABX8B9M9_9BACT|nr:Gfo/Idh/MocA family oxidoreductase [Chloracidobacterium validum]QUW03641.1 Gfo/Idh/MocA family oxidoreductase [Chloracidobacterium validum]